MRNTFLALSVFVVALASVRPAIAQSPDGFAVNRFDPSERGSEWFMADSLDLRGNGRFAAGAVLDYSHRPLVVYSDDDDEGQALIEDQLFGHLGASLLLASRVRLALDLPIALYQRGSSQAIDGTTFGSDNATTLGDLRLAGDVRLFGEYRSPVEVAAGVALYLPTGSAQSFTSDGSVRVAARAFVAGEFGAFVYASRVGLSSRPEGDGYAGNPLGSELFGAAAAGLRLGKLVVGPELFTSTVVSEGDAVFAKTSTPLELLVGAHHRAGDVLLGAGAGAGLTRGMGSPEYRIVASVDWAPEPEKEPGMAPAARSRPEPEPELEPEIDAESDRDHDGIVDSSDACPDDAGPPSGDPENNGCPPRDRDGDSVLDAEDACPTAAGPRTKDPKTNGCPLARIEAEEIKILEPVKFATNSDRILEEGEAVLEAVRSVLASHPEITAIEVRGHTDSRGGAAFNLQLSKRRAAAVERWLLLHGIDRSRVSSEGYGLTLPIDTNDTDEGRRNNRRVEFRIALAEGAS